MNAQGDISPPSPFYKCIFEKEKRKSYFYHRGSRLNVLTKSIGIVRKYKTIPILMRADFDPKQKEY